MGETKRERRTKRERPGHEVELLERVARGDKNAFAELYKTYYPRLFGYLLRMTGRPDVAEEVLDDVMVVVWRKAPQFESRSRVATWIFGIAYRQALRTFRRRGKRLAETDLDSERLVSNESPERDFDRRQRARRLRRALRALPPEQRAVVELTYDHGLSYGEIAKIVGCPVGTVKTRMFHARRKLRRRLPELETGIEPPGDGGD